MVLLSLLGASGVALATEVGVDLSTKAAVSALKKLPGEVLFAINKKVGFRLLTKFGSKGVINLGKMIPLVGGVVGGSFNAWGIRGIGIHAMQNFPANSSERNSFPLSESNSA